MSIGFSHLADKRGICISKFANERRYQESAKSPYVNLIAVREQDKDKPWVAKLVRAYHSDEIRQFIQTQFKGAVIAGF